MCVYILRNILLLYNKLQKKEFKYDELTTINVNGREGNESYALYED